MLNFKPLSVRDIKTVKPYITQRKNRLCDYTTGGIFIWRDYFDTHYTLYNDTLFLRMKLNGIASYPYPCGGNVAEGVDILCGYMRECGEKILRLCTVSEDDMKVLTSRYDIRNTYTSPDWSDYIYNADDLKYFKGRKYSGQRNHINKFKKLYPDYKFEKITESNIDRVREFYDKYCADHPPADATAEEEKSKIIEIFDNYNTYGLSGGAVFISADGGAVAFAIGEAVGDTLNVNIEKADISVPGSYQMIVSEFAMYYAGENTKYINREDDMGNQGLKTSKLSYHPVSMLEKYIVELNV